MIGYDKNTKILIFDGICSLCKSSVGFLHEKVKNHNYKFIASQSEDGKEIIDKYHLGNLTKESIVLLKNEKIFTKSKAVLELVNDMPTKWKLFKIFIIVPNKIRDYFYDIISKYRYTIFGKI